MLVLRANLRKAPVHVIMDRAWEDETRHGWPTYLPVLILIIHLGGSRLSLKVWRLWYHTKRRFI